jgi:hypothetical protein
MVGWMKAQQMGILSTAPSMENRNPRRPRKGIVRAGETVLTFGLGQAILRILNLVGNGESAMDVYAHLPQVLRFIGQPWFSVVLIIGGFCLLWRFSKQSEAVKTSQIIHPYTREPVTNPTYPAFRQAGAALLIAILPASAIWAFYKTPLGQFMQIEQLQLSPWSPSVPPGALAPAPLKPEPGTGKKKTSKPLEPSPAPPPHERPPVVIPVPSQRAQEPQTTNDSPVPAKAADARIGTQVVRVQDKAPGMLYVSVTVSQITSYHGTGDKALLDAVVSALKQTGKISVFLTGGSSYLIYKNDRSYGISVSNEKPKTIYYFDKTLDGSCEAVKTILSNITGTMDCVYHEVLAPVNPSDFGAELSHEFFRVTGLDMEVVL